MTPLAERILNLHDCGESVEAIRAAEGVSQTYAYRVLAQHRPERGRKSYKAARKAVVRKAPSVLKNCTICEAPFATRLRGRHTCSRECSRKSRNNAPAALTSKLCVVCGFEFETKWIGRKTCAAHNTLTRNESVKTMSPIYVSQVETVNYSEALKVRVTSEMHALIKRAAKEKGQKPSEFIRQSIQSFFDQVAK